MVKIGVFNIRDIMRKNNRLFFDDFIGINKAYYFRQSGQDYGKIAKKGLMVLSESLRQDYGEF